MDCVEAEGDSIDTAIEAALRTLQVSRERVEIEILGNATRGLFGIGSRKARVRATLRTPLGDPTLGSPSAPVSGAAAADGATDRARHLLGQITTHLGISADILVRRADDHVVLDLTGDTSGILIGRRGQMLDAMEYLVNRIIGRDDSEMAHIVIDSQNYRARRREALEDLARRMGDQAKRKRKPVMLNPMSPRDRRIVHLMLQEDPSLTTKSSGKGYFRRVIIIPAGAGRAARDDG